MTNIKYKINQKLNKLIQRWPLMPKKRHQKEINNLKSELNKKHGSELNEIKSRLDDLIPKLIQVTIEPDRYSQRYRLVTEFHEHMIRYCFDWGNDDKMLRAVSERLSLQVYCEIKSINFARVRNDR